MDKMFTLDKSPDGVEKLKANEVDKVKFYYSNRDLYVGNIFTVCIFISKEGKILSRGVSICSINDSHNKKDARDKSFGRAMKAVISKENTERINPNRFTIDLSNDKTYTPELVRKNGFRIPLDYSLKETFKFFKFKSEYNPIPTEKESYIATLRKK